jgi:type IV pilus assembly protein PilB
MAVKKKLGEVLIDGGLITENQLSVALQSQSTWGGKLGSTLVRMGFAKEEEILAVLSKQLGFPAVDFNKVKLSPKAVRTVPLRLAEKYNVIPVAMRDTHGKKQIVLVMSDPTNLDIISEIEFQTGYSVHPAVATESAIARAIDFYYKSGSAIAAGQAPDKVEASAVSHEEEMVLVEREGGLYDKAAFEDLPTDEMLKIVLRVLDRKGIVTRADLTVELRKLKKS